MKRSQTLLWMLIILLLPLMIVQPLTVYGAENDPVTFILHKRMYREIDAAPDLVPNDGLEVTFGNSDLDTIEWIDPAVTYGLNGVTFEVYDATQFIKEREANKMTRQAILNEVRMTSPNALRLKVGLNRKIATLKTATITGEDGIAKWTVNPADYGTSHQAFIFIETMIDQPEDKEIQISAVPMLVILPVENPLNNKENLNTIHLYPKNYGYTQEETNPLTPDDKPDETTPTTPSEDVKDLTPKPSGQTKPLLPQTGEAKTITGFIGILVIGFVFLIWRKNKKVKN